MTTINSPSSKKPAAIDLPPPHIPNHIQIVRSPPLEYIFPATNLSNQLRRRRPFLERASVPSDTAFGQIQLLPLTARLGLPLTFRAIPDVDETGVPVYPALELQRLRSEFGLCDSAVEGGGNLVVRNLGIRAGVGGKSMGFMDIVGVERPLLLIARVDAEDLWIEQVHALWAFVEEGLVRAAASAAVEGKMWFDEGICERFFAGMTPEGFVEFWETSEVGREMSAGGLVECPVKLGCKACGKDGGKLMRCGKCNVVKYCGSECQKGDWTVHKKVCKKF